MPKSPSPSPETSPDRYRIAAVARLAGMPETTIRMWERRYQAVRPSRSEGNGRLYSRAEIDRLLLLKAAVDAGHAIGTVAALDDEQLRGRLAEAPKPAAVRGLHRECRIEVVGAGLAERLRQAWADRRDLLVVGAHAQWPADGALDTAADGLIVELPTLTPTLLRGLRAWRAAHPALLLIVVYGFGTRQALSRLDQAGAIALAMPADPAQLARLCHLGRAIDVRPPESVERRLMQPAAPRRYDDRFLASVAAAPANVRCECPHHLADLLVKLNAFEQYSLECENADASAAAVHALLYSTAAQCRELLELALQRVLEHEAPLQAQ